MGFGVIATGSGGGNLDQIADGQVYRRVTGIDSGGKISSSSIGSGVITGWHIALSTIQDVHIRYGSIQSYHMASHAISSNNIQYGAVQLWHLAEGMGSALMEEVTLQSGNFGLGVVTSYALAAGAVRTSHLASSQVTSEKTVGWNGAFTVGTKTYFVANGLIAAVMG